MLRFSRMPRLRTRFRFLRRLWCLRSEDDVVVKDVEDLRSDLIAVCNDQFNQPRRFQGKIHAVHHQRHSIISCDQRI
jgi:hypothetical protein